MTPLDSAALYQAECQRHAPTLLRDGCTCGHRATGVELYRHRAGAIVAASDAHSLRVRGLRPA